ncbi:MAG: leucine-rich repeat domain-containing protein [Candidatus Helarchaeota archaeon]|nr:leucine-rich repeat domain-containing protein [Candidatus Helarchaeota archaeon]
MENGYNSNLLHSNLSLPLLKKLSEIGDNLAKYKFKEEITRRLLTGHPTIIEFFFEEECINYLDKETLWFILNEIQDSNFNSRKIYFDIRLSILERLFNIGDQNAERLFKRELLNVLRENDFSLNEILYNGKYIYYLNREEFWSAYGIDGRVLFEIEKKIKKYKIVDGERIYEKELDRFEYFKPMSGIYIEAGPLIFTFQEGKVTKIGIFGNEKEVIEASLGDSNLLKENIGYLELEELPESIDKLNSLTELILCNSCLKKLPKSIQNLKNLKELSLASNPEFEIPNFLWNLKSLEILDLSNNNLTTIPYDIERLENLKELRLYQNYIYSFPKESIEKLKKLRYIALEGKKYLSLLDDETRKWLEKY